MNHAAMKHATPGFNTGPTQQGGKTYNATIIFLWLCAIALTAYGATTTWPLHAGSSLMPFGYQPSVGHGQQVNLEQMLRYTFIKINQFLNNNAYHEKSGY